MFSKFINPGTPASCADARRAERNGSSGGFLTGFVVGGAIFGALGFLFAPQISAALLSEDQRLKLPKFLDDDEKSPEATKQVSSQTTSNLSVRHFGQTSVHVINKFNASHPLLAGKARGAARITGPYNVRAGPGRQDCIPERSH